MFYFTLIEEIGKAQFPIIRHITGVQVGQALSKVRGFHEVNMVDLSDFTYEIRTND